MIAADPFRLAARQLARDRRRTAHARGLFEHKLARMRASPLAFLRGTAPMFYDILRDDPSLAKGPPGEGWITGDLHLENFGAFRPQSLVEENGRAGKGPKKDGAVFDLNDFDDAIVGPWRLDVLRLMVSLVLGSRELRVRGAGAVELCECLLEAYTRHEPTPMPHAVAKLVAKVRDRSRLALLDGRTRVKHGGARVFERDENHYQDLPRAVVGAAEKAFARYAARIAEVERIAPDHLEPLDMAYRIAGTGSLGALRVAVLVRGKGGPDGAWMFDMKEQGTPSAAVILGEPELRPAKRVLTAIRACLDPPPRMLGATKLDGKSMLVRRMTPQEDKLDLLALGQEDLEPVARYLGALTGRAHRRAATRPAKAPWSKEARDALLDRAIAVAGIHEAAYLAYFKMSR